MNIIVEINYNTKLVLNVFEYTDPVNVWTIPPTSVLAGSSVHMLEALSILGFDTNPILEFLTDRS